MCLNQLFQETVLCLESPVNADEKQPLLSVIAAFFRHNEHEQHVIIRPTFNNNSS